MVRRRRTGCHNLLSKHIEWTVGNDQAVKITLPNGPHQCGAFKQIVTRGYEESSLGNSPAPVAGTPNPLQRNRNRAWRADLDDQIHCPDIDSKFQGRGSYENPDLTLFQLSFCGEAQFS
jgi:hypothetical protein